MGGQEGERPEPQREDAGALIVRRLAELATERGSEAAEQIREEKASGTPLPKALVLMRRLSEVEQDLQGLDEHTRRDAAIIRYACGRAVLDELIRQKVNIIQNRHTAVGRPLSESDLDILAVVSRFHYLTAAQLCRLLYPDCHDENRYARRRLASLAERKLLLRLMSLPAPRYGSAPHVFTLGREGRALLAATQTYYRPAEEQVKVRNAWFMTHTLATIDVLIAAEQLGRTLPVTLPRVLTERQLRADPLRVDLPTGEGRPARSVAVIPDAWFEVSINGRKPVGIALELDRGTEDQKRWRGKVAALAAWAEGPYRQAFANPSLTIAVVTPEAARRDTLRHWTAQELAHIGQPELAEIFLVTDANPVSTPPEEFFFGRVWWEPETTEPISLLVPATLAAQVIPRPGKEVWPQKG